MLNATINFMFTAMVNIMITGNDYRYIQKIVQVKMSNTSVNTSVKYNFTMISFFFSIHSDTPPPLLVEAPPGQYLVPVDITCYCYSHRGW